MDYYSGRTNRALMLLLAIVVVLTGCGRSDPCSDPQTPLDRESKIPDTASAVTPETDEHPPKSHSEEYHDPVPLPYPVNTAGAEDSAFILPCGNTLYFWFTPDVNVPPEKQLLDGVTGIYVTHRAGETWTRPDRVWLQDPCQVSLDGGAFVKNDVMWFCSAREGYVGPEYSGGLNWFSAQFNPGESRWEDWGIIEFPEEWEVGELHIHGDELYFHSARPGGRGGLDIWVMTRDDAGNWLPPVNVTSVNTERDEGWPAISPDGREMWISRDYGLWRSVRIEGEWSEPELMIFPLAGEASVDVHGNVYFTHHYFKDNTMIGADIYVTRRREP